MTNSQNTNPDQSGLNLSNGNRTETAEQRFIRILSTLAQNEGLPGGENTPVDDLTALEELESSGFITAKIVRGGHGGVVAVCGARITIRGREYLAELKHSAESQTSIGIIKHNRFRFYWWFLGTVGALYLAYRLWFIPHH
jgi:hypothetical protein